MKREDLKLTDLFGKDRAQEDKNLHKYFVKTYQYNEILSGNKELVLGRKGSGKSALFSYLGEELKKQGKIPVQISPLGDEFAIIENILMKYNSIQFDDAFKYSLAWREFILMEIAFESLKDAKNKLIINSTLYKYLLEEKRINGDLISRFSNAIIKAFTSTKAATILRGKIEINTNLSGFDNLTAIEKDEVENAFLELISGNEYFILIDNLDEPWKNTPQMNSWLRGLILCMRQLKRDFQNLKILTFLRDDIYDVIAKGIDLFDSENEILRLRWNDDNYFSLRRMLAYRISNYFNIQEPKTLSDFDERFQRLFPLKLRYGSMRDKFLYNYIIERTFTRPREFLQFCRLIIEKSQSFNIPVSQDSVHTAEVEFSDWKVRDIVGEYAKTYGNLEKCILSFAGLNRWQLSYNDICEHYETLSEHQKVKELITDSLLNPDDMIEFLYLVGFLRKVIKRHNLPNKYITSFEERIINVKSSIFDIHPAFRKKFTQL